MVRAGAVGPRRHGFRIISAESLMSDPPVKYLALAIDEC